MLGTIFITWQIVEALNTYTLVLSRVWPEDLTGQALERILVQYRWLANCVKSRATQGTLLLGFINQVLSTNASRGRSIRPPLSYKQIEECLTDRIWNKGIDKHRV